VETVTEPHDKLTTDPPQPPGAPDVDDLVGESAPSAAQGPRTEPEDEDVASDPVSVEPPD
jgi:hypothetical protein